MAVGLGCSWAFPCVSIIITGIVHLKMSVWHFSFEHKRRYSEKCWYSNSFSFSMSIKKYNGNRSCQNIFFCLQNFFIFVWTISFHIFSLVFQSCEVFIYLLHVTTDVCFVCTMWCLEKGREGNILILLITLWSWLTMFFYLHCCFIVILPS